MKILGVDPGSRAAGWAVVEFGASPQLQAAGVLRPDPSMPLERRLLALRDGLLAVIEREGPALAAVERVFSGVNPQSLITLGESRGVLLLALAERNLPVVEITPAEIKKIVTGSGGAEKEQVRRMVLALVGRPPGARPLAYDAADAAAAALAAGFTHVRGGVRLAAARGPARDAAAPPSAGPRRRPAG